MRYVKSLRAVCICIVCCSLLSCPDVPKTISVASVSLDKTEASINKGDI